MTYRERSDWIPYPDLLAMTLPERIKYVRNNLSSEDGRALTQEAFARATGKGGHHGVMAWEKGREPQPAAREAIAALCPYPARAFSLDPGAGASLATIDARLADLEVQMERVADLTERILRAQQGGARAGRSSQPATGTDG